MLLINNSSLFQEGTELKLENVKKKDKIAAPQGKLGVLIPGIGGAVATTFIAGVEAVRRKMAPPLGR